jgi:hypothetical protein
MLLLVALTAITIVRAGRATAGNARRDAGAADAHMQAPILDIPGSLASSTKKRAMRSP